MDYQDKTLICEDCQAEFIHSADDQQRYAERGFTNEPKRCRPCREQRKRGMTHGPRSAGGPSVRSNAGGHSSHGGAPRRGPRQLYDAVCSTCGKQTQVPFQPKEGRPVFCRDCYKPKRADEGTGSGGEFGTDSHHGGSTTGGGFAAPDSSFDESL